MGAGAYFVLAILAVACLRRTAVGVKVHVDVVAFNETEATETNEVVPDSKTHPHGMHGKPSKFDMNAGPVGKTGERTSFQVESTSIENSTALPAGTTAENCDASFSMSCIGEDIAGLIDRLSRIDTYNVTDSVQIVRHVETDRPRYGQKYSQGPTVSLLDKVQRYAREHAVKIHLSRDLFSARTARTFFPAVVQGKSTFLTGFGLGFLAFGLKKLLMPFIFGVQVIKSILLALFLPSIIGSIGNILGKGVSSFADASQTPSPAPQENYEFKDNVDLYNDDYLKRQPVGTLPASAMYDESMMQIQKNPEISSRYSFVDPRITNVNALSDRYYTRHVANQGIRKKQDFKVFHEIPTSSLLLTNYDPFYSPLLSRLDAVFSSLGHTTEGCREYAVCAMYRSPARYAPYSNLVSAQLSRELNELRKPSNDNPDVLRFFRYMKAAKDGQDGVRCEDAYGSCATAREDQSLRQNQAILTTYQDIDKLVHARKL